MLHKAMEQGTWGGMKRSVFLSIFVSTHVLFVVLQIHKQSAIIKTAYHKQKQEALLAELTYRKQMLTQQLYACKNHMRIKAYATQELAMQKVQLKQIQKCERA